MADYEHLEDNLEDDVELPEQQPEHELEQPDEDDGDRHAEEEDVEPSPAPAAATAAAGGPRRLAGGKVKASKDGKAGKKRKLDKDGKKKKKKKRAAGGDGENDAEAGEAEPSSEGGSEEPEQDGGGDWDQGEGEGEPGGEEIEEAEDAGEVLFGRKRKKRDETGEQMTAVVDAFLAKMEAAADMDREERAASRPAINKLKMVQEVEAFVAQRKYHDVLIGAGGLGTLKAWLEPYEDGTLPNVKVRSCVLNCCKILPIDTADHTIKESLKKSQLGSRIMFLAKCPDENQVNRKAALELVQKWSRPIFFDAEAEAEKRRQREEVLKRARQQAMENSRAQEEAAAAAEAAKKKIKYGQPGYRWHASIPQTLKLDYVVAPTSQSQSAVSEAASEMQMQRTGKKDESRLTKKMREVVRKQKGSTARAAVPSVEGRNIVF